MEWTDKKNCIVVIALHKFIIQGARICELLKLLNITRVFVHRTVKLFFNTGRISDRKRSGCLTWFVRHRVSLLLGQSLTEILYKNKNSWVRKWILRREPWIALSNKTWDFQKSNSTTPYCCIKRRKETNQDACCPCTVKFVTKKSSLQIKTIQWRKLSMGKTIEFIHGHPKKPANWCQESNEIITLPQWWFGKMGSLIYVFMKRALKHLWEITF